MLDLAVPDQALVDLVIRHRGVVTEANLRGVGYGSAQIQQFLHEALLVTVAAGTYRLTTTWELTLIDPLVLVKWAIPEGIVGGPSALAEHQLTLSIPKEMDICVPEGWSGEGPPGFHLHPFTLPLSLRTFGVMTITPDRPGTEQVAIYTPAVSVAQTLADPYYDEETREESLWLYRQYIGDEVALEEAARRYQVALPVHAR